MNLHLFNRRLILVGRNAYTLRLSIYLNYLGKRGAMAIERLMGMLLIMISVQMLLSGVKEYFA